jgi:hypothetical protein
MGITAKKRQNLDAIIKEKGYTDQRMDRYAFLMVY